MEERNLQAIDGATLMGLHLEPTRFCVDTLLPQGVCFLGGASKIGKSWMVLDWCVRIAKGEPVWGLSTQKGTTLYLCLEDTLRRVQDRLNRITDEVPGNAYFSAQAETMAGGLLEEIRRFVGQHPDTVLVVGYHREDVLKVFGDYPHAVQEPQLGTGHAVAVPPRHLCCGYPLLAAGMDTEYEDNMAQNRQYLASMLRNLIKQGFDVRYLATACGSCRDSLARMKLNEQFPQLEQKDVSQIVLPLLQHEGMEAPVAPGTNVLYHAACHCEWAGVPTLKGQAQLTGALEQLCKVKVSTIPGCCGESGMGAVTSPTIYNLLRARKKERLAQAFEPQPQTGACYAGPILVGCPSCKIGIARCLIQLKEKHPVLHVLEWLANQVDGEDRRQRFRRRANETRGDVRIVQC